MAAEPKLLIFDTDMGSDDAWALQMLLIAEKRLQNVKILAITCVDGNTTMENVIKNTYRMLWGLNRTDITIHQGAVEPLLYLDKNRPPFHGTNGMCDIEFWDPSFPDLSEIIHPINAVQMIRDLVMKYPKKVSIVGIGPLTNIALAAKTYPEIIENVEEIFIMGGNIKGVGNTTSAAEFNFYWDPEAAFIVLDKFKCKKTIMPWEGCIRDSIGISLDWRFDVLGKIKGPNIEFLNEVERVCFADYDYFDPCDAFLTCIMLFPECIRKKYDCYATVELHGRETRGQMCIGHMSKNPPNVTVIEYLHEEECKKALIFAADGSDGSDTK